LTKLFWYK